MNDIEIVEFAIKFSKLPKCGMVAIKFLLCQEKKEWKGNYSSLARTLGLNKTDLKESSNFRKAIVPLIEKGVIEKELESKEKMIFRLSCDWKEKITNFA